MINKTGGGPGTNQYGIRGSAKVANKTVTPAIDLMAQHTDASNIITPQESEPSSPILWGELHFEDGRNSDKRYRFFVVGDRVIFQWGRTGAVGQSQAMQIPHAYSRAAAIEEKLGAKLSKGYRWTVRPSRAMVPDSAIYDLLVSTDKSRSIDKMALGKDTISPLIDAVQAEGNSQQINVSVYNACLKAEEFEISDHVRTAVAFTI